MQITHRSLNIIEQKRSWDDKETIHSIEKFTGAEGRWIPSIHELKLPKKLWRGKILFWCYGEGHEKLHISQANSWQYFEKGWLDCFERVPQKIIWGSINNHSKFLNHSVIPNQVNKADWLQVIWRWNQLIIRNTLNDEVKFGLD